MNQLFAIITFRATGPIKTWSDMRGANIHNARTKPIDHGVPGAPEPQHLIGNGNLVEEAKGHLRTAGIDPGRLRKNGVIAYEAIMTASPAFFEQGTRSDREARLHSWTQAQVEFARKRWGPLRVVSMVLHLDEKTPHIHLVVLPLEVKSDRRRRNPAEVRWGLVGRTISGPGRFDELQDDYASAMAPFGLVRGIAGSGRKNEPMGEFIERTERAKATALQVAAAAETQRIATAQRERELLAELATFSASQLEIEDERSVLRIEQERVLKNRTATEMLQARLVADQAAVARERDEIQRQRTELAQVRLAMMADRKAVAEDRARLLPALQKAAAFLERLARLPVRDRHPSIQHAVVAANALRSAAMGSGVSASVAPGRE